MARRSTDFEEIVISGFPVRETVSGLIEPSGSIVANTGVGRRQQRRPAILNNQKGSGQAIVRIARPGEDDIRLAIGPFAEAYRPHGGAPVLLGIRPEALSPDRGDAPDGAAFEARIEVIEPTGADNLAFLNLGEREVIARLPPGRIRAGERLRLQIDPSRALLFDPRSEQRIG